MLCVIVWGCVHAVCVWCVYVGVCVCGGGGCARRVCVWRDVHVVSVCGWCTPWCVSVLCVCVCVCGVHAVFVCVCVWGECTRRVCVWGGDV